MLGNGSYSVWYRTQRGEGTGVIELKDGKMTGGDAMLAYTGSYVEDGDVFTAVIATHRHTEGQPSVFGIDNVDLTLTGNSSARVTATCSGTVKQLPGLTFEAVLIRIADQPTEIPARRRSSLSLINAGSGAGIPAADADLEPGIEGTDPIRQSHAPGRS
jgi:hypothetical protein